MPQKTNDNLQFWINSTLIPQQFQFGLNPVATYAQACVVLGVRAVQSAPLFLHMRSGIAMLVPEGRGGLHC